MLSHTPALACALLLLAQEALGGLRDRNVAPFNHPPVGRTPLRRLSKRRGPGGYHRAHARANQAEIGIAQEVEMSFESAMEDFSVDFDLQAWLPFQPIPGCDMNRRGSQPPTPAPTPASSVAPITLSNISSIQTLIEGEGRIVDGLSDVPDTTGICSFDLFADSSAFELGFFVEVQLGTPPRTFRMQIDTSSADVWVSSENCPTCAASHGSLGSKSSSTFVADAPNRWTTADTYSSNVLFSGVSPFTNVSGTSCNDTVSIAGLSLPTMAFGVTTSVENEYSADWLPFDGVLGLGNTKVFPLLSLQHISSPITQLAAVDLIPRAQVGIYVGRATAAGQLALGGVDASLFSGQMIPVPSISKLGYWEAELDIAFTGRSATTFTNRSAIFDTRSATISAPQGDLDALGLPTDGQGHVLLPCTNSGLTMSLTFGGKALPIRSEDLVLLPLTDTSCTVPPCCLSALQAVPPQLGLAATQWILGTAALKPTRAPFKVADPIMAKKETGIDKSVSQDSNPPPSAFDEPSTPSQVKPSDKPKETLVGRQEENPQVVVKKDKKDQDGGAKSKL